MSLIGLMSVATQEAAQLAELRMGWRVPILIVSLLVSQLRIVQLFQYRASGLHSLSRTVPRYILTTLHIHLQVMVNAQSAALQPLFI